MAFVVLLSGKLGGVALSRLGYLGDAAMSVAAIVGALAVMLLIIWVSQKVKGNVTLLIIGVMIGYLANAIIGVLKFLDVKHFELVPRSILHKRGPRLRIHYKGIMEDKYPTDPVGQIPVGDIDMKPQLLCELLNEQLR